MSNQKSVNKYVPDCVSPDLKWYGKDGLLTYIDQLKYSEFSKDPNGYLENARIVNFDMIHAQCRGDARQHDDKYYQTVYESSVKEMPQKEKKKALGACLRSERKDLFVKKTAT